jgi:ribosomal protein S27E
MLQDWLICPYCQDGGSEDLSVALDHEHIRISCDYCGSTLKKFHGDHELQPNP